MTNRELLELAAKAAEYEIIGWVTGRCGKEWAALSDTSQWNPLEDDGDALRLVVKLHLPLDFASSYYFTEGPLTKCGLVHTDDGYQPFVEKHGADPYAATRCAIVRAAAEIGKSMESK